MDDNTELKGQVRLLTEFMNSLKSTATIPWEVDQALRNRLLSSTQIAVSAKGVDTEDITINEGGSGVKTVMDDADAFLEILVNGSTYYIPVFTS